MPEQDKKVVESGVKEYQKEMPGLTLGTYVDISMFIKIGEGDWNATTTTREPIEIVIEIPENLQEKDREYVIIRAHDGVHMCRRKERSINAAFAGSVLHS